MAVAIQKKGQLNKKIKILVLHGPNLNLLGIREKEIYGSLRFKEINQAIKEFSKKIGFEVAIRQSNSEGEMVNTIQGAYKKFDGLLINPAAYSHTSIAIRDSILGIRIPTVEVHLSNIFAREEFRQRSFVAGVAVGQVTGFGMNSYLLGLRALFDHVKGL